MKTTRHILSILFIALLTLPLTACGDKENNRNDENQNEVIIHEDENQVPDIPQSDKSGISQEFKDLMDSYETFFDEYIAFMEKYSSTEDVTSLLTDYLNYLNRYTEMMEKLEQIDENELTDEEVVYYSQVMLRISEKLANLEN